MDQGFSGTQEHSRLAASNASEGPLTQNTLPGQQQILPSSSAACNNRKRPRAGHPDNVFDASGLSSSPDRHTFPPTDFGSHMADAEAGGHHPRQTHHSNSIPDVYIKAEPVPEEHMMQDPDSDGQQQDEAAHVAVEAQTDFGMPASFPTQDSHHATGEPCMQQGTETQPNQAGQQADEAPSNQPPQDQLPPPAPEQPPAPQEMQGQQQPPDVYDNPASSSAQSSSDSLEQCAGLCAPAPSTPGNTPTVPPAATQPSLQSQQPVILRGIPLSAQATAVFMSGRVAPLPAQPSRHQGPAACESPGEGDALDAGLATLLNMLASSEDAWTVAPQGAGAGADVRPVQQVGTGTGTEGAAGAPAAPPATPAATPADGGGVGGGIDSELLIMELEEVVGPLTASGATPPPSTGVTSSYSRLLPPIPPLQLQPLPEPHARQPIPPSLPAGNPPTGPETEAGGRHQPSSLQNFYSSPAPLAQQSDVVPPAPLAFLGSRPQQHQYLPPPTPLLRHASCPPAQQQLQSGSVPHPAHAPLPHHHLLAHHPDSVPAHLGYTPGTAEGEQHYSGPLPPAARPPVLGMPLNRSISDVSHLKNVSRQLPPGSHLIQHMQVQHPSPPSLSPGGMFSAGNTRYTPHGTPASAPPPSQPPLPGTPAHRHTNSMPVLHSSRVLGGGGQRHGEGGGGAPGSYQHTLPARSQLFEVGHGFPRPPECSNSSTSDHQAALLRSCSLPAARGAPYGRPGVHPAAHHDDSSGQHGGHTGGPTFRPSPLPQYHSHPGEVTEVLTASVIHPSSAPHDASHLHNVLASVPVASPRGTSHHHHHHWHNHHYEPHGSSIPAPSTPHHYRTREQTHQAYRAEGHHHHHHHMPPEPGREHRQPVPMDAPAARPTPQLLSDWAAASTVGEEYHDDVTVKHEEEVAGGREAEGGGDNGGGGEREGGSSSKGGGSRGGGSKKQRENLPKECVAAFKAWLYAHISHPYPTEEEKLELIQATGVSMLQLNNWFINARVRIWRPIIIAVFNAHSKRMLAEAEARGDQETITKLHDAAGNQGAQLGLILQDQVASYGLLEEAERGSHDLDRPRSGLTEVPRAGAKLRGGAAARPSSMGGPDRKALAGSSPTRASASAGAANASPPAKRRGSAAKK